MSRFYALFLLPVSLSVSGGNGFVFSKDTTASFFVSGNEIYSPDKNQLLYFSKGNIFFNGTTDEKQNIFLLTTSMNPADNDLQLLYEKDNREPVYSFTRNRFYVGKTETEDMREKNEMLHIEKSKKFVAFYASYNDSLLAYYKISDSLPSSTDIILSYILIQKFGLEKKIAALMIKPLFENTYSSLKPAVGNATANEWIWDGKVLRLRWDVDQKYMWTFDGQIVKQVYGNSNYYLYSWDGENFKPLWRNSRPEEWNWDGRQMKPVWDTDWANQYIIADGMVKPWSNVHPEKEWHLDGDIPIPLIILVISGIARAN